MTSFYKKLELFISAPLRWVPLYVTMQTGHIRETAKASSDVHTELEAATLPIHYYKATT